MSHTPNRRLHEDGGNGSGSGHHGHPSGLKHQHEDQGTNYGLGGKLSASVKHDHHAPHDVSKEGRIPKITPRSSDSREPDRRAPPLLPNMLFRVPTSNDTEHRDSRESTKENKVEIREGKSESKEESVQAAKSEKHEGRVDDAKDTKLERESFSEVKGHEKLDKDAYGGSQSQWNWKDHKEPYRSKQYSDAPAAGGKVEPWKAQVLGVHSPAESAKEGSRVADKDISVAREDVGENKVDMKLEDRSKDKDRKAKEVKNWWGERAKDKNDRGSSLQPGNSSTENKEASKEEKVSEHWGTEKKELTKDKEKINEQEKDNVKKEAWNVSDKDSIHKDIEMVDAPGKAVEGEKLTLEPKKRDHDPKGLEREARDKKKEREGDVEPERPDKRVKYHEKESDDGNVHVEGGSERERDAINSGTQPRKRMLLPRGSPQAGNRIRISANDNEGSQGKSDVSSVVYKVGECMQELVKLWNEYKSQADKASEGSQTGPTLEIRIPAEHVTATNRQVRGGQLWGTDIYTVDSDLVAVLMHTGYCRPTASTPPSAAQELKATVRVLPSQECYVSTLRNNVRSRAWGAASDCSYRVERCCIVKKGGGIIDLEPCLTHSSTMEPTLAPVAVERTMTTRAAASNALRQQRFVREVTILFNLCMEPWLKYSISTVADKGLKKSLFTSARLKKGEVLYVETHSRRYELCFNGEKPTKAATASHGAENGRSQNHNHHLPNGEKNGGDVESVTVVDTFRWSRCKNPLPQKTMLTLGIPLPNDRVEVLEENIEWDEIGWSQTGVWVAGKVYNLARAHFLAPN